MDLQYIDGIDAVNFACADIPFDCSFCGKKYKEHEDFETFFQGVFDENGKITCCKKCFENKRYEKIANHSSGSEKDRSA